MLISGLSMSASKLTSARVCMTDLDKLYLVKPLNNGLVLSSTQIVATISAALKMMLVSRVIKSDSKIIISFCWPEFVIHFVLVGFCRPGF